MIIIPSMIGFLILKRFINSQIPDHFENFYPFQLKNRPKSFTLKLHWSHHSNFMIPPHFLQNCFMNYLWFNFGFLTPLRTILHLQIQKPENFQFFLLQKNSSHFQRLEIKFDNFLNLKEFSALLLDGKLVFLSLNQITFKRSCFIENSVKNMNLIKRNCFKACFINILPEAHLPPYKKKC